MAAMAMSLMEDDEFMAHFSKELFPIPNFRAIVWGRFQRIDSPEAQSMAAMYAADFAERTKS
jgi:hypothetical protein